MTTEDHPTLLFRTSSRCSKGACVEVATLSHGGAVVRDSKDRTRGPLIVDSHGWTSFIAGVQRGDFDF